MNTNKQLKKLCYESLFKLFGEINDEQLEHILSIAKIVSYDTGQYVFQQDDPGNAFYIVLSGRFRVLQKSSDGIYILGDIAVGEPIGEFSLFTRELHSASVVALRKSIVISIADDEYTLLIKEFPSFANIITRFVIERMRRNALQKKVDAAPKNIAVVNLQPENDVSVTTAQLQEQLINMGMEITIYNSLSISEKNYESTFDDMDKHAGLNILVCDSDHIEWAKQSIAYCDLVIVATEFYADCNLYEIEKLLNLYSTSVLNKKIYLLLFHPEDAKLPENTRRWFENRNCDLHIHFRKNNLRDIRRFCRIITHQAIGLVLGGGGARGFAHTGVVKALLEAGLEFDFVGGTSAGGLYGTAITYADFDMEKIMRLCKLAAQSKLTSNDYTLPFVSLMSGKKIRRFLQEMYNDTFIEDLWVNSFCVSTNFSNASIKVHENGLLRKQVEASIAIPGVFPPVIINQNLHIDGGVIDNLPVESINKKPVRYTIAVSLSAENTPVVNLKEVPSSWKMFWDKITKSGTEKLPGLSSILIDSITINSRHRQEQSKQHVSLFIELDLKEYKFLDWNHWEQIIQKGYDQTKKQLADTPEQMQFWKL
ncbi:MAG: patatin-like phospholipase family protein [Bacteroidota bacterium]|nr:patatin-like phospholipase family protein [Bacteroidota bacterium]